MEGEVDILTIDESVLFVLTKYIFVYLLFYTTPLVGI